MADQTLVQGAGLVAQTEGAGKLAAAQGATKVAAHLAEGISTVVQKRNREFNAIVKATLAKTESMDDETYKKLSKTLERKRAGYVYLNKKERLLSERDLLKFADNIKKEKIAKNTIASDLENEGAIVEKLGDDVDDIKDILDGTNPPITNENGDVGYIMRPQFADKRPSLKEFVVEDENGKQTLLSYRKAWDDGRFKVSLDGKFKTDKYGNKYENTTAGFEKFQRESKLYWINQARKTGNKLLHFNSTTGKREYLTPDEAQQLLDDKPQFVKIEDIQDHVKGNLKDKATFGKVDTATAKIIEDAKTGKEFNRDAVRNDMMKIINDENTNLKSLASDKNNITNSSFKSDLTQALQTANYDDLGIFGDAKILTKRKLEKSFNEKVESLDPNTDGDDDKISQQDAETIVEALMSDQGMLKEHLSNYFTKAIEQQHYAYTTREKQKNEAERNKEISEQQIEIKGGSIDDDGNYVPDNVEASKVGGDAKDKEPQVYKPSLNDTQNQALSPLGITGKGAILENGKAITVKDVPTPLGPANITGMRVDGLKIMVDTSLGMSRPFGEFKKSGNKYKWEANSEYQKLFKQKATKEQQASFNEFIKLVESDPEYAATLMGHTQSGRGTMNAATLEVK